VPLVVTVIQPPNSGFSGIDSAYCIATTPVTLNPVLPNGTFYINSVSIVGNTFTPNTPGRYLVRHILGSNCKDTTTKVVNVYGYPTLPTITRTDDTLYIATQPFWKYQWQRNGVNLINDTLPRLVITSPADYSVVITSQGRCKDTTAQITVLTGLNGRHSAQSRVYPNPAHETITILGEGQPCYLINALGQRFYIGLSGPTPMDIRHLTPGVYWLEGKERVVIVE
jgi:hypothetical protein